MARKSKHENNDLLIDLTENFTEEREDLLAQKNSDILSSFGENTIAPKNNGFSGDTNGKAVSPLDALKSKMKSSNESAVNSPKAENAEDLKEETATPDDAALNSEDESPKEMSLLEKLKRYTTDDEGHDVSQDESPLYKLESVAEIIKNDSSNLINKLSEKYDVTVDNLGKPTNDDYILKGFEDSEEVEQETEQKPDVESESEPTPTPAFEKMADESKKRFEKNLFDELFPQDNKSDEKEALSIPDISDIDSVSTDKPEKPDTLKTDTATIRFTPAKDKSGNTGRINISSATKPIDIRQELTNSGENEISETDTPLEMSDFNLFSPEGEVTDILTAKTEVKRLSYKKRRSFLGSVLCALCLLVLLLFLMPFLSDKTISSPKSTMTVCTVFLFISILANMDMFKDIANLFKRNAGHDCIISLCAVFSVPFCIFAIVTGENIYHFILTCALILFARSVISFMQTSTLLSNLKRILSKGSKHAVTFIKDSSTALAMAKNTIDGDVLIAAPRKANFINDFMKFSLFKKKLGGRMPIVFLTTVIFSVLSAVIASFYYKTVFAVINAAAITSMIAAMPVVCFIDVLPLFFAAKKLRRNSAMITGTFGADSIEMANAVVVGTNDIFPVGSISLKNFKVLSDNNIDRTIVNAAALTEEIGSPLAPVFNKIAGTNTSYQKPDSDTIKYEEKLGISGWVDNQLLFIGNRTLMEAHGIEVPSIEVDKKILRNGYFPVYVSTGGQACALIVIEYIVKRDIQKTLKKISKLGITMLVENCDPNVNEEMICDYFGLYDDSVKVMTNVGTYMYRNATADIDTISAPAVLGSKKISLLNIMCAASNIRVSNVILSVFYILAALFGVWYFVFTSFTGAGGMMSGLNLLVFEILATAFAIIAFLFKKP